MSPAPRHGPKLESGEKRKKTADQLLELLGRGDMDLTSGGDLGRKKRGVPAGGPQKPGTLEER